MATEEQMRFAMQAYIDRFNAHDGKGLAKLFADNARIEDPVGGTMIVEGRAAIDEFYRRAVTMVDRLELAAPIRTSHGVSDVSACGTYLRFSQRRISGSSQPARSEDEQGIRNIEGRS